MALINGQIRLPGCLVPTMWAKRGSGPIYLNSGL